TGEPLLFGPSPEISMTRRKPWYGFSSSSGIAKLIAPEIEVREARRIGVFMISEATASAVSGPSITRQGMMIFWSVDAAHSKYVIEILPFGPVFSACKNSLETI